MDWSAALARGGAAEFDGEAEKNGMLPLRQAAARLLSCGVEDVCVGSSATELLCSIAWAVWPNKGSNSVPRVLLSLPRFTLGQEWQNLAGLKSDLQITTQIYTQILMIF